MLKEAMIQEINADAKDGINIFVTDEKPLIKFNNFNKVEVLKHQPLSQAQIAIDVYPGQVHKPQVTLTKLDNFRWGDFDEPDEVYIKEVPVYIK